MLIYPDVEVLTLATERAQQSDNQNTETNDSRFFLRFGEGSFGHCHRLIGTLVLTVALLALSAALLSLYLQGSSRLDNIYTVRESLSLNLSHNMADMENLREDTLVLARNLSSLLDNISSIQEQTLSALMLNQTEILQEMEKQGQLFQMELRQYIHLQQRMDHISRTYLPIPRKSPLLRNCERRNQGTICPFCSAGWHFFGLSCYLLSPQTRNWQDSLHWCRKQGAHLVVINSQEEQEFLQAAMKTSSWIGLSDRDMEGQWEWVDGTPYNSTPKFWFQKQPDNLGNEDCAVLLPGSLWNDNKCRKLYSSVCEYKAGEIQLPKESLLNVLLGP
ncbi:C-type lectin domain family 10 member A-like [Bufo gargarizans]|uniref:C-type lectin domain family 10 member A-like n=1 Tax=Bufo gargarizans TaxID=30331 RepID=UPI001CF5C943|nr:C-type lectin domain family 10 member A-like [Bufo gargarizans]